MANRSLPIFIVLIHIVFSIYTTQSLGDSQEKILLRFKKSLLDTATLSSWDNVTTCCNSNSSNWTGVLCLKGNVIGLRLEAMGLLGKIDVHTLSELPYLRSLSIMNNYFSGPVPDIKILGGVRSLYMANNQFLGRIPDDAFDGMNFIRRIDLANNVLNGPIPMSLTRLVKLVDLQLQNNAFEGRIPVFYQPYLVVNFANNQLEGPIPHNLISQNASSFYGNRLCGKPLEPC